MIMIEEVNAVGVKFRKSKIRAGREKVNLYPKTYVFKISPVQAKKPRSDKFYMLRTDTINEFQLSYKVC